MQEFDMIVIAMCLDTGGSNSITKAVHTSIYIAVLFEVVALPAFG
jgi:phage terminase large subunit GpA-like protein